MNTEKYAPLIEELDHLMWKTEKRKNKLFVFFVFWGWFFLFYLLTFGMALLLRDTPVPLWMEYSIIFFGMTVIPALFIIGILKLMEKRSESLKKFIEKTKSILYRYEYSNAITDDVETLLQQSKEIHETLLYVYKYYKKNKDSLGDALYPFIKEFEQSTLKALYDIRNDLLYHSERKKEDIFRAEWLLMHENMKSVAHVSEAQKIRLDAQIGAFEQLEKILVKI
jgi:hypothetical protein